MDYWIDTHAHIYAEEFSADRQEMLNRAHDKGVTQVYMPNVDSTTIDDMMEVESRNTGCYAMMGLHPCSVKKGFERELYVVEEWLMKRKFAAVGEIGTDRYWDTTYWDHQCEAFRVQSGWARNLDLPIVIHCRESLDQTVEMVETLHEGSLSGVFHCFTGTVEQAERIIKLGFYVGIGGVVTFKNGGLEAVLPSVSIDHIVLETDSPYLSPVPHRGKRNEPSYIPLIAQRVADIKGMSVEEVMKQTTLNAQKLFERSGERAI